MVEILQTRPSEQVGNIFEYDTDSSIFEIDEAGEIHEDNEEDDELFVDDNVPCNATLVMMNSLSITTRR